MESDLITKFLLPGALAIIMFGLGLTLTIKDFKHIFLYPKAVLIGALTQLLLLPILGLLIAALLLQNHPELAVGLVLLSACPGGPTSNLFTHLGNGDIALCITLTAISSCIKIFTIPLIVNFSLHTFMHMEKEFQLDVGDSILKIFFMIIVPALLGMGVRAVADNFANKVQKPLKIISIIFLGVVIITAVIHERNHIIDFLKLAGPAALALNIAGISVGYFLPQLFNLNIKERITIGIETSVQNGTLAITIATSPIMLNNITMAIPAVVYSTIMFFTTFMFIGILNRKREKVI